MLATINIDALDLHLYMDDDGRAVVAETRHQAESRYPAAGKWERVPMGEVVELFFAEPEEDGPKSFKQTAGAWVVAAVEAGEGMPFMVAPYAD